MLRVATASVARRAVLGSSRRAPQFNTSRVMAFHASPLREEESKVVASEVAVDAPAESKGGFLGTGISEWFALPIGMAAAVPILHFDLYVVNEETQLAAVFVAFCVAIYTQAGDAIYKSLSESGDVILKELNEAEDKLIEALKDQVDLLKSHSKQADHLEAFYAMREEGYAKLNAAGVIKPQHDFKAQVERILNMITQEEASNMEKTKTRLVEEATAAVKDQFANSKELKKAALDSAIATIKGSGKAKGNDPVRDAFVKFFKEKAAAEKKSGDDSEEKAQRATLIAKMNALAENEGFYFKFDESGKPQMTVA